MSLVALSRLLPLAFDRIDRAKNIHDKQTEKQISRVLKDLFPEHLASYSVAIRGSTIIIQTNSIALKHKVYADQKKLLGLFGDSTARSISFAPLTQQKK